MCAHTRSHLYDRSQPGPDQQAGVQSSEACPPPDPTSALDCRLVLCTGREASQHMCLEVQPTFEGFHVLKVPRHCSIHGLCVPLDEVIIEAAPVGTSLARLLPRLDLVAGNVDGPVHMGQAVHQSTVVLPRDGIPAVHHSVAAANQPPAGDDMQI